MSKQSMKKLTRLQRSKPAPSPKLVVECPGCEAKVEASVLGDYSSPTTDDAEPVRVSFLQCAVCGGAILAAQDLIQIDVDSYDWSEAIRLWPSAEMQLSWEIPPIVRVSIEEARRCFKARAFTACAVMCGRALEGICRHHNTRSQYLGGGLEELLQMEIIDKRLFEWGGQLKKLRNVAAHATEERISSEDARDILTFVTAISEYIFVLSLQFQKFMARRR